MARFLPWARKSSIIRFFEMTRTYHRVLTIAGSDSGGGAGIQADLKTFAALGCYGLSVVTAITAQNTRGVTAVHALPASIVQGQLEAVLSDIGADAVKIGMLHSGELIETVGDQLKKYQMKNIVLDPVLAAQSGASLLDVEAIDTLKKHLLPLVTVFTPNLPEASVFLSREVHNLDDMHKASKDLTAGGCENVLLKGGHLEEGDSTDLLYIGPEDRFVVLKGERISTRNNHGTGCTLSSALAAYLATGFPLEKAAQYAKEYMTGAIRAGAEYEIGHGRGPVHHFYKFW